MKNALLTALLAVLLAVVLTGCDEAAEVPTEQAFADMDPITIRFAHAIPQGELMNYIIEDWMAAVTRRSGGKITFDYYPSGQLGTFVEIIEQVDLGAVNMSSGEPSLYEPWCPEVSMLYAPLICDGYDHLGACIYGRPGRLIAEAMAEKSNTRILDWVFSGARVIAAVRPLRTLEDMKGLIIRSPESQVYIDTFTLLGMSPTPMAMAEMYKAMQLGVVEACECPAQALYEGGYHRISKNICITRHMYALGVLSANGKFWDSLPGAARTLLLTVFSELKDAFNARVRQSEDEYYAKFAAEGLLVTDFADRRAFRAIAEPYWNEKAASIGGSAQAILDAINALRP